MTITRRRHSADFKAKVASEALRGHKTQNEIASEYGVLPLQVTLEATTFLDGLPSLFGANPHKSEAEQEHLVAQLYQQIGLLKVEVYWMKKNSEGLSRSQKGSD